MGIAIVTSFVLVYILMVVLYGSFLTPFVIMFSVPVALVGALLRRSRITHQTLNLFSLIGMIMLFGLVAKNGILLVDYANTLRHAVCACHEAMRAGGRDPVAADRHDDRLDGVRHAAARARLAEGAEFRQSMGTVLIGGLLSSLILTLFLVPVIYAWVVGRASSATTQRSSPTRRQAKQLPELPHRRRLGYRTFQLEALTSYARLARTSRRQVLWNG